MKQSAGSVADIGMLEDSSSGVDVAFVQGGTADAAKTDDLVALASLFGSLHAKKDWSSTD